MQKIPNIKSLFSDVGSITFLFVQSMQSIWKDLCIKYSKEQGNEWLRMDVKGANSIFPSFLHLCIHSVSPQLIFQGNDPDWVYSGFREWGLSVEAGVVKEGFWEEVECEVSPLGWVGFPWRCVWRMRKVTQGEAAVLPKVRRCKCLSEICRKQSCGESRTSQ